MNHKIKNHQNISKHCMVCGTDNPYGLKTRFYETEENEVVALFSPQDVHQSYPDIAHGGVTAAILDETIGRAIMAFYDQNTFGITIELNVKYKKPVPLGVELKAVGRITKDSGRIFAGTGELYLPNGELAATAEGKYLKRNLEQITDTEFIENEWFPPVEDLPDEIEL
ncbi:MAG: PaaI family thioesterase [Desulfuromonadales bacterium]|nr:PaaI family thioesterase [Chloroflexota bacterium]MCK4622679.1 PaaI family thioesterase [Desulfuromonadales bacterium]